MIGNLIGTVITWSVAGALVIGWVLFATSLPASGGRIPRDPNSIWLYPHDGEDPPE